MNSLRILSLLPAATEIVYLLGLEKYLVGVTDDCDYPAEASKITKVTECLARDLSSLEIDQKVRELGHMGMSVSHLDPEVLKQLKPNLILTQDLCKVCAVSYSEVKKAARVLEGNVRITSLEPESIEDILENILLVGELSGKEKAARVVVDKLQNRIETVKSRLRHFVRNDKQKKVLIIEWLEPLMNAGHWVPEMVERAGGVSVKTHVGHKSYPISIDQIVKADPDVIIFAPCGFDIERTLREKYLIEEICNKIYDRNKNNKRSVYLMDGGAYLTRPGPRIIDGVEILAEILHPEIFPRKYKKSDWCEFGF